MKNSETPKKDRNNKPFIPKSPDSNAENDHEVNESSPNSNPNYSYFPNVAYPTGDPNATSSSAEKEGEEEGPTVEEDNKKKK